MLVLKWFKFNHTFYVIPKTKDRIPFLSSVYVLQADLLCLSPLSVPSFGDIVIYNKKIYIWSLTPFQAQHSYNT